jgi:hypothetical protein
MATPPDFTSGAVLTAAQMNSVGLWLVKTQTIGAAALSETVTGAFSADYDNYLIQIIGGTASTEDNGFLTFGATATGYYGILQLATVAAPGTYLGSADNNGTQFSTVWRSQTGGAYANINVYAPFLTKNTGVEGVWMPTSGAFGKYTGQLRDSTSYTAFTVKPASGTFTGGTIRVYGYRK